MNIIVHIVTEWLCFGALLWFKPARRVVLGSLILAIAIAAYFHLHRWVGQ
jgi:hypothetical protein